MGTVWTASQALTESCTRDLYIKSLVLFQRGFAALLEFYDREGERKEGGRDGRGSAMKHDRMKCRER